MGLNLAEIAPEGAAGNKGGDSIYTGTDTIQQLTIKSPQNSKSIKLIGNFKNILIEGGEISNLDITKITNDECNINIVTTHLINPQLFTFESVNPYVFLSADISNAYFATNSNSILSEELQLDEINSNPSFKTKREEIKKRFTYLITAYYHLSKIFINQKKYDLADYFDYRAKICERKSFDSKIKKAWYWFYNEKLRGDYGTSLIQIMWTFLTIGFVFSVIYFLLGVLKFAFCYSVKVNNSGEDIEEERPEIKSLGKKGINFIPFYFECLLFSFSQMLLGGITKDFARDIFRFLVHPPKRYVAIGVGKFLGIIQYILGILILFFFISAFIRMSH